MTETDGVHEFDDDQHEVVEKEFTDLVNLWNAYMVELTTGSTTVPIHPPPAFLGFLNMHLSSAPPGNPLEVVQAVTDEDLMGNLYGHILLYGNAMFRFGQWCLMRGLPHSNLTPCNCDKVTDEDIHKLLDGR